MLTNYETLDEMRKCEYEFYLNKKLIIAVLKFSENEFLTYIYNKITF